MKLGDFFEGKQFDSLDYEDKQLWWTIQEDMEKANSTNRLEELIAKYALSNIPHTVGNYKLPDDSVVELKGEWSDQKLFEYELNTFSTAESRRNWFEKSPYYLTVKNCKENFATLTDIGYKNWDEAISAVLKGRVEQTGEEVSAGSLGHEVQYFELDE